MVNKVRMFYQNLKAIDVISSLRDNKVLFAFFPELEEFSSAITVSSSTGPRIYPIAATRLEDSLIEH